MHTETNQFADSATDKPRWQGLSPLGKEWVAEMNRQGMVIDGSHASDTALEQMIALSKTSLLLSHSAPRATLFDQIGTLSPQEQLRVGKRWHDKMWSGNVLRILGQAEAYRQSITALR